MTRLEQTAMSSSQVPLLHLRTAPNLVLRTAVLIQPTRLDLLSLLRFLYLLLLLELSLLIRQALGPPPIRHRWRRPSLTMTDLICC